jgi:GGDEF domain-containing protein
MHHQVLNAFLDVFGDRAEVMSEIRSYWARPESFTNPVEIYRYLLELRVSRGVLSRARADVLEKYFAESFLPEPTTGYLPKHRLPLIEALNMLHARENPERRIYRVEADIGNLGGLNRDIEAAGGGRSLADAVVRVMSGILREELETQGQVTAIRQGGDELCLFVKANNGFHRETVTEACSRAQRRIADFVLAAGLRDLPHTKNNHPPGVGIGVAVVDDREPSEITKRDELESGILESKGYFQTLLGDASPSASALELNRLQHALTEPGFSNERMFSDYARLMKARGNLLDGDADFGGDTPDDMLMRRLGRGLQAAEPAQGITEEESRLLEHTVKLSRKYDFVTGLPMYGAVQHEIAPNFSAHFGSNAHLVHIDFNNLGGGNKLGSWVGDAMAKQFVECIAGAMETSGFSEFMPYLSSQGGGKFALLLPQSIACDALKAFANHLGAALMHASAKPLPLTAEQVERTNAIMRALAIEEINSRRDKGGIDLSHRPIPVALPVITINDINGVKSRRNGSSVVCHTLHVDTKGLDFGSAMEPLEKMANMAQNTIADFHERRWQRLRGEKPRANAESHAPGTLLKSWQTPERLAEVGKIKL